MVLLSKRMRVGEMMMVGCISDFEIVITGYDLRIYESMKDLQSLGAES